MMASLRDCGDQQEDLVLHPCQSAGQAGGPQQGVGRGLPPSPDEERHHPAQGEIHTPTHPGHPHETGGQLARS